MSENDKKKAQNLLVNLGVIHFTDKKGKPSDSEGNPVWVTKSKKLTVYSRLFCVLERIEFIQMSDKRAKIYQLKIDSFLLGIRRSKGSLAIVR